MATNIETEVHGNILTIKVDLSQEHGVTGSGKSIKIASSDGNIAVLGREDIKLGLNDYKPRTQ
jgi:hypothetical protein